jgi:hypothetical protein
MRFSQTFVTIPHHLLNEELYLTGRPRNRLKIWCLIEQLVSDCPTQMQERALIGQIRLSQTSRFASVTDVFPRFDLL